MNNQNKNYWSLKTWLNDTNLLRDVKTWLAFLLAYALAVVSNGLIDEFNWQSMLSIGVSLGAVGTYFSIKIITNEFTERGAFDETTNNASLTQALDKQKELSQKIDPSQAYDILDGYNKSKHEVLQKEKLDELKSKYEEQIKRNMLLIENSKLRNPRWFNFITQRYIRKLKTLNKKTDKRLKSLNPKTVYVKYDPIDLTHLRTSNIQLKDDKLTEAQRFKMTPQRKIRRDMGRTNFIKTFFFISFQGAVLAQITSWRDFFVFIALMSLTLASTAVFAYLSTRRYANENFIHILNDKNQKLQWLIDNQK